MEGRLPRWSCNLCVVISTVVSLAIQITAQRQSDGWGPWTVSGQCSRKCGGGVQRSTRRCLTGRPGSGSCQGIGTTYESCNTQACPEGSLDFRAYQCSAYNAAPTSMKGRREQKYTWAPYYEPRSPCDLICENEYGDTKKLRESVIDGTPCDTARSFGICIDGFCKPTGCDHTIGSVLGEDKCLTCGGTGEHCETVTGSTLGRRLNRDGKTEVIAFPVGATSIRIVLTFMFPSTLELENEEGRSIKLTEAQITFGSRKMLELASTIFTYMTQRDVMTFTARGPINETLHLYVRYEGMSPLVEYEYSTKLQRDEAKTDPTPQRYEWVHGGWTQCSRTCGHGYQLRAVSCMDQDERNITKDELCSRSQMPAKRKACNAGPCKSSRTLFRWSKGRWGECNVNCGVGEQVQSMLCVETGVTGSRASVSEDLCERYAGKKPVYERSCRGKSMDCPSWVADSWSECSVTCGRGVQTRRVTCQPGGAQGVRGDPEILAVDMCPSEDRPEGERSCAKHRCGNHTAETNTTQQLQDCKASQFGCCPDEVTPAKGDYNKGCKVVDPVPDLCELPKDRGICSNYTVKWFFNSTSQQCRRFWFGNCGGNDNRFDDRESCTRRCLNKQLKPEGCATSVFGCCADNRTFARGENGEGCPERPLVGGCAGTRHGCCDDGVTSATGPEKLGCPKTTPRLVGGCAGTRHGCCRDGKTSARGPQGQGCPENTARPLVGGCTGTRYGCCRDGRTIARGENYLGCKENPMVRCRSTRHGCCQDGRTPARGPDREGCPETKVEMASCGSSRFGCCPDGVAFAQGPNQEGCSQFSSEFCGYDKDPGGCSDYSRQWFFSVQYGVCREFWYGGCRGNANRFQSKDECQEKCVKVTGIDRCSLPVVKGPCKAKMNRYYFDPKEGQCKSFVYGGCRSNANNFMTHGECRATCNGKVSTQGKTPSACDRNPCQNGFVCSDRSDGSHSCSCNPDWGTNCERPPNYWCFSDDECGQGLKCVRERTCSGGDCHVYARCAASSRRYTCDSRQCSDKQDCVNDYSFKDGYFCVDKIQNPRPSPVVLDCRYSKHGCCDDGRTPAAGPNKENCARSRNCQNSVFGCCPDDRTPASGPDSEGCLVEGSGDVPCERTEFGCCDDGVTAAQGDRKEGCEDATDNERVTTARPVVTARPATARPSVGVEKCTAPASRRRCTEYKVKWRYSTEKRKCERHWWGGCRDNGNVFDTQRDCDYECRRRRPVVVVTPAPTPTDPDFVNICDMPQDPGPCRASMPRFYHDPKDGTCKEFIYGGCRGNENNFQSLEDCRRDCMKESVVDTTAAPAEKTMPPPSRSTMRMAGRETVERYTPLRLFCQYMGSERVSMEWIKDGQPLLANNRIEIRVSVTFDDGNRVEMRSDLTIRVARMQDGGNYMCRTSTGSSESKTVTVVDGQRNAPTPRPTRPTTRRPIVSIARSNNMTGDSSVASGETITITCKARGPKRPTSMDWFINGRIVNPSVGTASVANRMDREDRNMLVSILSVENAGESNEGVYYCRSRPYGDLQKMTIKVLEGRVPVTQPPVTTAAVTQPEDGQDVCMQPEKPGRCLASFQRWRYDHMEGRCVQFIYGGCEGNSNNFETEEDCDRYCQARDICYQPKKIGMCRAAMPRFYFDSTQEKCAQFIFGGCTPNANNFVSMEACERKCGQYVTRTPVTTDNNNTTDTDVCEELPEKGSCRGYHIKWYYSKPRNTCSRFIYTGCDGNGNRFDTEGQCQSRCVRSVPVVPPTRRTRPPFVTWPPVRTTPTTTTTTTTTRAPSNLPARCVHAYDRGDCDDYKILWYYDAKNRRCLRFYYGGCGGNDNRYKTQAECESVCVRGIVPVRPPTTTQRPVPCQYTRYGCCSDGVTPAADAQRSNCQVRPVTPRPAQCQYTRYGCCRDGVTAAADQQRSNCGETPAREDYNKILARPATDVTLQCPMQGGSVSWYREGFILTASERFVIYNNGTLILRELTEDMAGYYACRYTGNNNRPQLERFKVEINLPLTIVPGPTYINLKPGENGFLHCQASGNPQPRVSWRRDGQALRTTTRHSIFGNGTLIISNAQPADEGRYECVAENGVSQPVSRLISLSIKETIEAKIERHAGTFLEGETIRLQCEARGFPTPTISWEKEGRRIANENRRTVRDGELVVRSASIEDAGVYKCVASNDKGSISDYTTVQIKLQTPKTKCEDTLRGNKCRLIVAGRLCGMRTFAVKCCQSCRRAGYLR